MSTKPLSAQPENTDASPGDHTSLRARLDEKIEKWRKRKYSTAAGFFLLGALGLFLPVIPGMLFLAIAFWLIFPKQAEKIWGDLKRRLGREEDLKK
jgi:hypothetical protein